LTDFCPRFRPSIQLECWLKVYKRFIIILKFVVHIKVRLYIYEAKFFLNLIKGRRIISWAAVDTSKSYSHCNEIIGFVIIRVITPLEGEVSPHITSLILCFS
jgi:hypothetical protein